MFPTMNTVKKKHISDLSDTNLGGFLRAALSYYDHGFKNCG